jgi:NAD-dependent dihydropyrimidine dehydrogenase PreA subunit
MKNDKWFGIPRDEIDWFPKIDYKKCIGCMACLKKCSHGVYSEENGKPKVVKPKNCVVGCTGCDEICPQKAISHPSKEYLEELVKRKDFKMGCNCGGNCQ